MSADKGGVIMSGVHIMVDLETMGTDPSAPVISIGAVSFNSKGVLGEFYSECSLESAVAYGAKIDAATVSWWMRQDSAPRLKLANATGDHRDMLKDFAGWCDTVEPDGVWGNGASFDNVILSRSFKRVGMETPWPFWADRCYRTVKNMFDVPFDRLGEHHNALDDAKTQANHLVNINAKYGDFL